MDLVAGVLRMHEDGWPPSAILRAIEAEHPGQTVVDFMDLMRAAFGLSFEAVQCIGGWWHDGTGELTDHQLDAFLKRALEQAGHL
jgi:hypothetical protein